ncbi:capsule assembly Wzi family protein [bacterium]|nr:capsule assembly Wzi family protein [bacterium]
MRRLLVAALLLVVLTLSAYALDVDLNHPVYAFLERCELKGYFPDPLSGARPYTRRTIALHLTYAAEHRLELTTIEKRQLDFYLFEFTDDLPPTFQDSLLGSKDPFHFENRGRSFPWSRLHLYDDPRYIYSQKGDDYLMTFNPHFEYGVSIVDGESESGSLTGRMTGFAVMGYYNDFGLLAVARDEYFSGKTSLADQAQYPVRFAADEREENSFTFDQSDAMFSYENDHVQLTFGKGNNKWDWGQSGSLGLSGNSNTYTQLRYRLTFQPFEVTGIHARLRHYPLYIMGTDTLATGTVQRDYAEKWMVGHHYQVNLFPWFQLGLWDLLIYGGRGLEFDYIAPLSFLWSTEHYAHDQDNVMLGVDGRITPGKRSEIYFQWFLDELQFGELGSDWWGNKHGYLIGARQIDPLGMKNASMAIEYQRLRPYIYTHSIPYNNATHYGLNLGSSLPPNSELYYFSLRQMARWNLETWIELSYIRHGATPLNGRNVGGDVNRPHWDDHDPEKATFLDGNLHSIRQMTVGASWQITYQLYLDGSFQVSMDDVEDANGATGNTVTRTGMVTLRWHPAIWRADRSLSSVLFRAIPNQPIAEAD